MKNRYRSIVLLVLIISCYSGFAQIRKEKLMGTWVFDYSTSVANMEAGAKKVYSNNTKLQVGLEKSYRSRQLIFYSDGRYLLRLLNGKQVTGTWNMNALNGNKILLRTSQRSSNLTIVQVTASSLVLKPINEGNVKSVLGTWYFTKKQ